MATAQVERLFYSVAEAATALRLSEANVRQRCSRGEYGAVRVGKLWRIPRGEIDQRAAGHETVSSQPKHAETVRELRRMYADMGRLIAELEG